MFLNLNLAKGRIRLAICALGGEAPQTLLGPRASLQILMHASHVSYGLFEQRKRPIRDPQRFLQR